MSAGIQGLTAVRRRRASSQQIAGENSQSRLHAAGCPGTCLHGGLNSGPGWHTLNSLRDLLTTHMKILEPLRTLDEFCKAYDNGGHFWSLGSDAGDGIITTGEISKTGPSLVADRAAILYFELLRGFLPAAAMEDALASLDGKAKARWKKHQPSRCSPAEALLKPPGTAVIVECLPVRAYDAAGDGITYTQVVMIGKVMVPIAVPVVSRFRLWRLDDGSKSPRSALPLLAVEPKKLALSDQRFAIGAFVHESSTAAAKGQPKRRCLTGVAACPL